VENGPWPAIPLHPPYVLPCDSEAIRAFNAKCRNENHRLELRVLPEPFVGRMAAPVVLLTLNPGFEARNVEEHSRPEFQALIRRNYGQEPSAFPLYYLDPGFEGGGREWCEKKLKNLLAIFGRDKLARSILLIDYFPYHSRRFGHANLRLPSQECGFGLVRSAIARGAVVVIMRARSLWLKAVPEIEKYPRAFSLNSPQNVVLSPRNCPTGFDSIVLSIRRNLQSARLN
jgi:hypothetical protein